MSPFQSDKISSGDLNKASNFDEDDEDELEEDDMESTSDDETTKVERTVKSHQ